MTEVLQDTGNRFSSDLDTRKLAKTHTPKESAKYKKDKDNAKHKNYSELLGRKWDLKGCYRFLTKAKENPGRMRSLGLHLFDNIFAGFEIFFSVL